MEGRHKAPARGALAGVRGDAKGSSGAYDPRGAGTAWSHNFLNQKFWHPANFKNQARVYEAEQDRLKTDKRNAIAKQEFEAEQEYMKTLSYLSPEEQKKHADRQAVAFMYQKPPGIDIVEKKAANQQEAKPGGEGGAPSRQQPAGASQHPQQSEAGARSGGRTPSLQESGHLKNVLGGLAATLQNDNLELKPGTRGVIGRRSPPRGGHASDANQKILVSDSDEERLAAAPTAQQLELQARLLLKQEKRAAKAAKQEKRRKDLESAEAFLRSAGVDPADVARQLAKKMKKGSSGSKDIKKQKEKKKRH